MRQATNVLGGAFSPAVSPDGRRVAFVEYTAKGYDLRVMDIAAGSQDAGFEAPSSARQDLLPSTASLGRFQGGSAPYGAADAAVTPGVNDVLTDDGAREMPGIGTAEGWREAGDPQRRAAASASTDGGAQRQDPGASLGAEVLPATFPDTNAESAFTSKPYSALDTVGPRLWLPWFADSTESGTLYGLVTGGQDVLQRHRWLLTALYGPESGRFMHSLAYAYDGLRPTISLLSSDLDRTYADLLSGACGTADYTERERALGVAATLAFPGFASSQALSLGYTWRLLDALPEPPPVPPPPARRRRPATWDPSASTGPSRAPAGRPSRSARRAAAPSPSRSSTRRKGSGATAPSRAPPPTGPSTSRSPRAGTCCRHGSSPGAPAATPRRRARSALGGETPGDVALTLDAPSLPLRGYPPNAFRGENALLLGLEYRFPLREIGRGGDTAPFFWRRLHGALFVDAGEAWDEGGARADRLHAGVGAELRLDLTFSYGLPLTLRLGVAWGLDEEGGVYPTLGITMPQGFLGAATPTGRR